MILQVVAAAVVQDGKLLTVSKKLAPDVFYLPGGKPEVGESHQQTLTRELLEELSTPPSNTEPYLVVEAPAALEDVWMQMAVYRCSLRASPRLAAELADLRWVGAEGLRSPDRLAPALVDVLLPQMVANGLLA